MSEVTRYKRGERLTYIPKGKTVFVMYSTLGAGGANSDEAVIWVMGKEQPLLAIPVAIQDTFLRPYSPPTRVDEAGIEETDDEEEETVV